jgi:hypothetical protein
VWLKVAAKRPTVATVGFVWLLWQLKWKGLQWERQWEAEGEGEAAGRAAGKGQMGISR